VSFKGTGCAACDQARFGYRKEPWEYRFEVVYGLLGPELWPVFCERHSEDRALVREEARRLQISIAALRLPR